MKILLAVDGSSYTKKMLAYLTTHDELFTANNWPRAAALAVVMIVAIVLPLALYYRRQGGR